MQNDFDWPAVKILGQIRRFRLPCCQTEWESVKTTLWIAGGTHLLALSPAQIQGCLWANGTIENAVFYVRAIIYDEGRLYGRKIGYSLSSLRNGAINLIRQAGTSYIPDARRILPSTPDSRLVFRWR